jgi:hypothetical protein
MIAPTIVPGIATPNAPAAVSHDRSPQYRGQSSGLLGKA